MKKYDVSTPMPIEIAFKELSPQAFAVWIRLMLMKTNQLAGRARLARELGYSPSACSVILRELGLKGYIKMIAQGPGRKSVLAFLHRPILSGPTGFITLSNCLFPPFNTALGGNEFWRAKRLENPKIACGNSNKNPHLLAQLKAQTKPLQNPTKTCAASKRFSAPLITTQKPPILEKTGISTKTGDNLRKTDRENPTRDRSQAKTNSLIGRETTHGIAGQIVPQTRVKVAPEGVGDSIGAPSLDPVFEPQKLGGTILISKYRLIREKNKQETRDRLKKAKESKTRSQNKSQVKINWEKLDQRGNPSISFSPSGKQRKVVIGILDQPDSNKTKQQVLEKMASEFGRIYSRYRRLLQKQRGAQPTYKLPPQERRYAARAAEWCIRKGVTPKLVLAYWHMNIGNFAERKMEIPPLSFLSSAANIDTVACASVEAIELETKRSKDVGHGFSDEGQLDHRLRASLERAGYETILYNDRHLLTIQKTAQALATGARLFVGHEMKPLVDWAAEHLYSSRRK